MTAEAEPGNATPEPRWEDDEEKEDDDWDDEDGDVD